MSICPQCHASIPGGASFCSSCGSSLRQDSPGGATIATTPPSSRKENVTGEYQPGDVLTGRYRIVSRIGRGGMGEVYRADDLDLEHPVALKLLPAGYVDPDKLKRLRSEVRLTRQVSHPNVCRVYDIGDAEGRLFIAMEFIQGEDLSSLLRRIGRLPEDKGIEIARQVCAGLAAIHDQGIIHRDLKPANIMIDERGRARVTDFGLASDEDRVEGEFAGTPAYMAPEQIDQGMADARSDIYALGLVLYELFTGKAAREALPLHQLTDLARSSSSIMPPSSIVASLDPAIERVIEHCLRPNSSDRPATALSVAAALPGGDPLAEALAAGETPSPELIAASGGVGSLPPLVAVGLLLLLTVGVGVSFNNPGILGYIKPPKPDAVLKERAIECIAALGYADFPVADQFTNWAVRRSYLSYIGETDTSVDRWKRLGQRPYGLFFEYRQSPSAFSPDNAGRVVSWSDPAWSTDEMVGIQLDPLGNLLRFVAINKVRDRSPTSPTTEPDWARVFDLAGLDFAAFAPIEERLIERFGSTQWRSWSGPLPVGTDDVPLEIKVYVGAARGRVNSFAIDYPWTESHSSPTIADRMPPTQNNLIARILGYSLLVILVVGPGILAYRNVRLRRADIPNALRLGAIVLASGAITVLMAAHNIGPLGALMFSGFPLWSGTAGAGILVMLTYLGAEPIARKRMPGSFVSWNRLLAGRVGDPMVGRDLLIGFAGAALITVAAATAALISRQLGEAPWTPASGPMFKALPFLANTVTIAFMMPPLVIIVLVTLELIVRKRWIVFSIVLGAVLTLVLIGGAGLTGIGVAVVSVVVVFSLPQFFGILPLATFFFFLTELNQIRMAGSLSAWYAWPGWIGLIAVAAVALYAFFVAIAGQPLFFTRQEAESRKRS